jgi:hypothetical protein
LMPLLVIWTCLIWSKGDWSMENMYICGTGHRAENVFFFRDIE